MFDGPSVRRSIDDEYTTKDDEQQAREFLGEIFFGGGYKKEPPHLLCECATSDWTD